MGKVRLSAWGTRRRQAAVRLGLACVLAVGLVATASPAMATESVDEAEAGSLNLLASDPWVPVQQEDGSYLCTVNSVFQFKKALEAIKEGVPKSVDVTVKFTADARFTSPRIAGVEGYHLTLTANEGVTLTVRLAEDLVGDLTLDRVRINGSNNSDNMWCNGFDFETTENTTQYRSDVGPAFQNRGSITLYGGSKNDEVASTDITLSGGAFKTVYGGGSDNGSVTNDTNVTVGGSANVANVFGGGLDGTVGGDTYVVIEDAASVSHVYGGGEDKSPAASDESDDARKDAKVEGDTYVKVTSTANGGSFYGGSLHSIVGGDVNLEAAKSSGYFFGTGFRDTVNGTVTVKYGCQEVSSATIYGTGGAGYKTGAGPVRVLNSSNEEQAITIDYTAGIGNDITDLDGQVSHFGSAPAEVAGDVIVNIQAGSPETLQSKPYSVDVKVSGDTEYNILGTTYTYYLEGLRAEAESEGTTDITSVNVGDGVTFTTSFVQDVDVFDIGDDASVRITGWSPLSQNWGNDPFQGAVNLVRLGDSATLDTNPVGCTLSGSVEMGQSSIWRLRGSLVVNGDFKVDGTATVQLPVVAEGENYHDDNGTIPLRVKGEAAGTAKVQLMARSFVASGVTVPEDVANTSDIKEGQDYVIAAKQSEDSPSANTFTLANENVPEGLSLSCVVDPQNDGNRLWQITKEPDAVRVVYSFKSGTRGASLPEAVTKLLPVDSNHYSAGDMVEPRVLDTTKVRGPKNHDTQTMGTWTFIGWDKESVIVSDDALNKDGYIEFEGTWTWKVLEEASLSYEKNAAAATGSTAGHAGYVGDIVSVAECGFVRPGHHFSGWNTKADGSGTSVNTGDDYALVARESVLYAQWTCDASPLVPTAISLTAYEGGLGSRDATVDNPGDTLPVPVWRFEAEGWTLYIGGVEQPAGASAFNWGYFPQGSSDQQEDAADRGVYELRAWALEGDPEVVAVAVDGTSYILDLDESPVAVRDSDDDLVTVSVRSVTAEDEAVEGLSADVFKPVYGDAASTADDAAGAATLAAGDSALEGVFGADGLLEGDCSDTEPHAHLPQGATLYKNGNPQLPLESGAKIALLWDELLSDVLGTAAAADGTPGAATTVFWPYPEGVTDDDEVAVVRFTNLTRDYTVTMNEDALETAVASSTAEKLAVTKTDTGVLFEIPSQGFGPIEMLWEGNGGGGVTPPPSGGDPDDSESSLPDFDVDKKLTGRGLVDGEFDFAIELVKGDKADVSTACVNGENDAEGNVTFEGGVVFKDEGVFEFELSEVLPADDDPEAAGTQHDGVTYDEDTYRLVATVTEDEAADKLVVSWDAPKSVAFENVYEDGENPDVPDTPDTPDTPDEPEDPDTPQTPSGPEEPDADTDSDVPSLPDTGDIAPIAMLAIGGAGTAALAAGVLMRRRK